MCTKVNFCQCVEIFPWHFLPHFCKYPRFLQDIVKQSVVLTFLFWTKPSNRHIKVSFSIYHYFGWIWYIFCLNITVLKREWDFYILQKPVIYLNNQSFGFADVKLRKLQNKTNEKWLRSTFTGLVWLFVASAFTTSYYWMSTLDLGLCPWEIQSCWRWTRINIICMWVFQLAEAIYNIESPSLFKAIVWFPYLLWVHNSDLWRRALRRSLIFFYSWILSPWPDVRSVIGVLWGAQSLRWTGPNEGWSLGLTVCRVSGQRLPLCVVIVVTKRLLWKPAAAGGLSATQHPSGTTAEGANAFPRRNCLQHKQDYDYFIIFIYLGLSSIWRKWLRWDISPTKRSIWSCVEYFKPDFVSEAFSEWIFSLLQTSSYIPAWAEALRSGGLQVGPNELVHYGAFLSLTHFPPLLTWLQSSTGACAHRYPAWMVSTYISQ